MRAALLEPFKLLDGARTDAGLYTSAVELVLIALAHHPSLVDFLLFPTALQGNSDEVSHLVSHLGSALAVAGACMHALPAGQGYESSFARKPFLCGMPSFQ